MFLGQHHIILMQVTAREREVRGKKNSEYSPDVLHSNLLVPLACSSSNSKHETARQSSSHWDFTWNEKERRHRYIDDTKALADIHTHSLSAFSYMLRMAMFEERQLMLSVKAAAQHKAFVQKTN